LLITVLKSKIHQATVTGMDVGYEGSIVIDVALMDEVGLHPWEKVLVANIDSGARFETYAIEGEKGSGSIQLNGAAALLGTVNDRVTIFAFTSIPESEARGYAPKIIQLGENNRIVRKSFE
jgi:aspartate 1-decarboxylase